MSDDERRIGWGPGQDGLAIVEKRRRGILRRRRRGTIESGYHDPAYGPTVLIRLSDGDLENERAGILNVRWERA
jgi:hypothetical protein